MFNKRAEEKPGRGGGVTTGLVFMKKIIWLSLLRSFAFDGLIV